MLHWGREGGVLLLWGLGAGGTGGGGVGGGPKGQESWGLVEPSRHVSVKLLDSSEDYCSPSMLQVLSESHVLLGTLGFRV